MKLLLSLCLFLSSAAAFAVPTTLTTVTLSETAAAFADNSADPTNGNRIRNAECDLFLLFRNSHETDEATATVVASGRTTAYLKNMGAMTKSNSTVSLTAGQEKHLGPFRCTTWNDSSGYVQLTFSGAASSSVKVTPLRVPQNF